MHTRIGDEIIYIGKYDLVNNNSYIIEHIVLDKVDNNAYYYIVGKDEILYNSKYFITKIEQRKIKLKNIEKCLK